MSALLGRLRVLGLLVARSLRQHALSTTVTVIAAGLASGLVMAVFGLSAQTRAAFTGGPLGFDAVLGARGSELQLVLNAVYHLETSPGNVPWRVYEDLRDDPRVTLALPYAVGDSYRGFRVVGTTEELFTTFEPRRGETLRLASGRPFDETLREAVIGSTVARRTGLGFGSHFQPAHNVVPGAEEGGEERHDHAHDEEFVVVGVLAPTGSPLDRVVFVPIDAVFHMEGHVLRGAGVEYRAAEGVPVPDEHKEVSAVLLAYRGPQVGNQIRARLARDGEQVTLAAPVGLALAELFEKLGWVVGILELVAYLVVGVAAASILASLYNTMNERRRELAVLRALGAKRRTVFGMIVLESTTIAALGAVLGFAVYGLAVWGAAEIVAHRTGVVLDVASWHPVLVFAPLGMIAAGALAGLAPAVKAYATDVATHLAP